MTTEEKVEQLEDKLVRVIEVLKLFIQAAASAQDTIAQAVNSERKLLILWI